MDMGAWKGMYPHKHTIAKIVQTFYPHQNTRYKGYRKSWECLLAVVGLLLELHCSNIPTTPNSLSVLLQKYPEFLF